MFSMHLLVTVKSEMYFYPVCSPGIQYLSLATWDFTLRKHFLFERRKLVILDTRTVCPKVSDTKSCVQWARDVSGMSRIRYDQAASVPRPTISVSHMQLVRQFHFRYFAGAAAQISFGRRPAPRCRAAKSNRRVAGRIESSQFGKHKLLKVDFLAPREGR